VRWEVVARTSGITQASILAGRLRAEGIAARVWQEGAGQAIGLVVGILGTGNVAVPAGMAEEARRILATSEEAWDEEEFNDDAWPDED
jgi:hypothetical protein